MVLFIGRMGNTKQALQLITNELGDVNQAIDFCKEHNERELWEDLITYSIDKPSQYWHLPVFTESVNKYACLFYFYACSNVVFCLTPSPPVDII